MKDISVFSPPQLNEMVCVSLKVVFHVGIMQIPCPKGRLFSPSSEQNTEHIFGRRSLLSLLKKINFNAFQNENVCDNM